MYNCAFVDDPVTGTIALIGLSAIITALPSLKVLKKPFDTIMGITWEKLFWRQR